MKRPLEVVLNCRTETKRMTRSDGTRMGLRILRPLNESEEKRIGILWIHGGGYIMGMKQMVDFSRSRSLVEKYGAVVISPGYRLAIEKPYPTAIEDCYDALKWMVSHAEKLGIRDDQIFVGGESAGGGLTAALCILARDRGEVNIAYQMPLYPMIDSEDTESSRSNHNIVWNTTKNHIGWKIYLRDIYGSDNVPVYASAAKLEDFSNLPPAYTFVCTGEPFYCETVEYIEKLKAAGVEADCDVYEGLFHAFDLYRPLNSSSQDAIRKFEEHYLYAAGHYFKPQNK